MKFFITIILTGIVAFACGLYLPWWSIAIAAFIVALCIRQHPFISFLSGLLGIFIFWGLLAWLRDDANESILSVKIANLLGLGGSSFLLILIVALVGGLIGGISALSAGFLLPSQKKQ